MFVRVVLLVSFLLGGIQFISAQIDDSKKLKSLEELVKENEENFKSNPEVALYEIDNLIKQAELQNKDSLELQLISNKTYYYSLLNDFEKMYNSSLELQKKAKKYNHLIFEARGYKFQARSLIFNELYDRAKEVLQEGLEILDNAKVQNSDVLMEKGDFYAEIANIYTKKGEKFNAIQALKISAEVHEKVSDENEKRIALVMDYANLGGAYNNIKNADSAELYAQKSMDLISEDELIHGFFGFLNYVVLGNSRKENGDLEGALKYYKEAEKIKDNKHYENVEELYVGLIDTYDQVGDVVLREEYKRALNEYKFQLMESKNKSLLNIAESSNKLEQSNLKSSKLLIIWILLVLIIVLAILLIFMYYKNRAPERVTPEVGKLHITSQHYARFIELIKKENSLFLSEFEKEYPDFISGLQKINSELSQSDLELLAMIRLNLSSKEIARYKNLHYRSVENNRYLLRKKLNISSERSLQNWVKEIAG